MAHEYREDIPTTVLKPEGTDYDKRKNTVLDVYPYDTETGETTGDLEGIIVPTDTLEGPINSGDIVSFTINGELLYYKVDFVEEWNF